MNFLFKYKVTRNEVGKLARHISFYLQDTMSKLYLRHVSSLEWQAAPTTSELLQAKTDNHSFKDSRMELPYFTKFLLIASFLASYNPPRFDTRFFARNEERTKKKGGATRKMKAENLGSNMRQQLVGPKSFPVERMLAIFYSIVDDHVVSGLEIQTQIMSLVNLKLLTRNSTCDNLDGIKCKCNVSFEFIKNLSHSVRFDVSSYLYDFC